MPEVHLVVGCAVIALNLVAFAVGGVAWYRDRPSVPFWYLLRAAQAAVFVQVMLGMLLVFTNHKPDDDLQVKGDEISLKAEGGPTCLTRPILRA